MVLQKSKARKECALELEDIFIQEKRIVKKKSNKKKKKPQKKAETNSEKKDKNDKASVEKKQQLQKQIERAKTVFWSRFRTTTSNSLDCQFELPDLVKTFRVCVFAVSTDGVYGTHTTTITICKPFNMVVESPLFVRPDETVTCKMILENNRDTDVAVDVGFLGRKVQIPKRQVYNVDFDVSQSDMPLEVQVTESGQTHSHRVSVPVYLGLTYEKSQSLKFQVTDDPLTQNTALIELPENIVPGSLDLQVEYKQLSADVLVKGLDRLVREPYGCFEQTSATTFPLVMLIQYIDGLPQKTEKMLKMRIDAEDKMKRGIKRLLGYECSKGGFEWFGSDPGHPTLSAYGIWQFVEMNAIGQYIDVKIIDRTLDWLRKLYQKTSAEFKIKGSGYDSFSRPPQFCSDIYIAFIMTLMQDYHVNYKSIVSHKIADYEAKPNSAKDDIYLSSFIALVYQGEPWPRSQSNCRNG